MRISSQDFLFGLRINHAYFFKVCKKIGIQSRYFFNDEDLFLIRDNFPISTFKTALISERARHVLDGIYVK